MGSIPINGSESNPFWVAFFVGYCYDYGSEKWHYEHTKAPATIG
jgi:hypothetical protein